jgi:hypothetical protein
MNKYFVIILFQDQYLIVWYSGSSWIIIYSSQYQSQNPPLWYVFVGFFYNMYSFKLFLALTY